jgi:hypothetical protein
MRMPSDSHKQAQDKQKTGQATSGAGPGAAPVIKSWPFAPGSQLGNQVARPWTPKPSYRFNQR